MHESYASTHDPLCGSYTGGNGEPSRPCYCDLIIKVRAHERERMVEALVGKAFPPNPPAWVHPEHRGLLIAARVVQDERVL
jgi:hypothetical protein